MGSHDGCGGGDGGGGLGGGGDGGGGGVGGNQFSPINGYAGGSGIVVVRGPSEVTFTVTPGGSTSTHPGGDKIATFTASGTLTVS